MSCSRQESGMRVARSYPRAWHPASPVESSSTVSVRQPHLLPEPMRRFCALTWLSEGVFKVLITSYRKLLGDFCAEDLSRWLAPEISTRKPGRCSTAVLLLFVALGTTMMCGSSLGNRRGGSSARNGGSRFGCGAGLGARGLACGKRSLVAEDVLLWMGKVQTNAYPGESSDASQ